MYSKVPEFLFNLCCFSRLWVLSDAWCLTFSFSCSFSLFLFISLLNSSASPLPSLPTGTVTRFWQWLQKSCLCTHSSKLTRLRTPRGEDLELNDGSAAWPYRMSSTLHVILWKTEAQGPSSARQQSSGDIQLNRREQSHEEDAPPEQGFCGRKHSHLKQLQLDLDL